MDAERRQALVVAERAAHCAAREELEQAQAAAAVALPSESAAVAAVAVVPSQTQRWVSCASS